MALNKRSAFFLIFAISLPISLVNTTEPEVKYASKCETCKLVVNELQNRLAETGKNRENIETSKGVVGKYEQSELRFVETIESVCERILSYSMHKEHKDSKRFAKGTSQTMQALHGLVDRGVNVELGIPFEMWDSPSVEITQLKQQCEQLIETFEDDLEQWFFTKTDQRPSLTQFLCKDRVLRSDDTKCLTESDPVVDKIEL